MYQSWRSLLFLHWKFPPEAIRPLLPPALKLDTFEGEAYVGLVPFTTQGVRPAGLPSVPCLSNFHETNVRTYVQIEGRNPGVWFFSLDAANPLAVALARRWFALPYYYARMSLDADLDDNPPGRRITYRSERRPDSPINAASFISAQIAAVPPAPVAVGTLDHFLIERYLLYTVRRGRIYRGQVHHPSYPVQPAEILACEESLLAASQISRPDEAPIVHFSGGVDVEIFSLHPEPGSARR